MTPVECARPVRRRAPRVASIGPNEIVPYGMI